MVWLTGAALVVSIAMILGLLGIVVVRGGKTFWPQELKTVKLVDALRGMLKWDRKPLHFRKILRGKPVDLVSRHALDPCLQLGQLSGITGCR